MIRVQLADVDHQSILDRVRVHDNAGRRRILLRSLIHQALGVDRGTQGRPRGAVTRTVTWRGSRREVDIVFGNASATSHRRPSSPFTTGLNGGGRGLPVRRGWLHHR